MCSSDLIHYDENFDGLGLLKRVVRDLKAEIVTPPPRQPVAVAKDLLGEAQTAIRTRIDLLGRAEREELRVRVHPRDIQGQERFLNLQARRISLSIFATATAAISSIICTTDTGGSCPWSTAWRRPIHSRRAGPITLSR